MAGAEQGKKLGWRERMKAAKRERAARRGDSPEKLSEPKSGETDVKDAASGTAVRGTVIGGGIGGGV